MSTDLSSTARLDRLIEMAGAVLRTHRALGPVFQSTPTLDYTEFAEWQAQSTAFLYSIVGESHPYATSFARQVRRPHFDDVQTGLGILRALRGNVAAGHVPAAKSRSALDEVASICRRFHVVAGQLRERHAARSTLELSDEYDVQDLLHALLRLFFEDVRPEEGTPSYAGKSSRLDFLLKSEALVVEVKMTRPGLGAKEIGTQLTDDIARYGAHPDCKTLVCFVYDPEGHIKNPRGLESDLRRDGAQGLKVEVLVAPRGY